MDGFKVHTGREGILRNGELILIPDACVSRIDDMFTDADQGIGQTANSLRAPEYNMLWPREKLYRC